ncbi:hypothetical protein PTKIN_Ptkin01aG0328300 [Pterospermum kingtungense]
MENKQMLEGLLPTTVLAEEAAASITDGDTFDHNNSASSSSVTFAVIFSTLVAMSGEYAYGNAVGYSSPAKTGIMEGLGLSLAEYAVFGSAMTLGGTLGAVFSGKIADLVGRRVVMGISEVFCIIGWLAIALSKVPVYVVEITTKNIRGAFTSLTTVMICFGKALMFVIGSLINWRTSALIGAIPCVLQLLGVFFIPESPRWLAKTNRMKEFEAALQCLRGKSADISQESADITEYTEYLKQISDGGILNLFQRRYINPLIVGTGLMLLREFVGLNGFSFYTSVIFESAGFPSTVGSIAVAVLETLAATMGVLFIDKSGRRPLLLISAAGTCLACVITGLSFFLQDFHVGKDLTATLVLIGVLVFFVSFDLGLGGIPWIIVSETFPVNIKGSAGSLVNLINWTSSWVVAYTFIFLFEWNSAGTFFIFAIIGGAGTLFIAKLVPETKGRTLEEIQASMT